VDIRDYRQRVKLLADVRNGGAIFNGSADHAAIIVENLFRVATHHVRMYGNHHVVQRAEEFLGHSDHRLEILVERDTFSASHPFVRAIAESENVSIKLINAEVSEGVPYHFMTADEDCYRFEELKGTHKAVAAFGDRSAMHLAEIFSQIDPFSTVINTTELHHA
jgi:hypothetical protein